MFKANNRGRKSRDTVPMSTGKLQYGTYQYTRAVTAVRLPSSLVPVWSILFFSVIIKFVPKASIGLNWVY